MVLSGIHLRHIRLIVTLFADDFPTRIPLLRHCIALRQLPGQGSSERLDKGGEAHGFSSAFLLPIILWIVTSLLERFI